MGRLEEQHLACAPSHCGSTHRHGLVCAPSNAVCRRGTAKIADLVGCWAQGNGCRAGRHQQCFAEHAGLHLLSPLQSMHLLAPAFPRSLLLHPSPPVGPWQGLAKIMHHERSSVSGNLGTLNWVSGPGGGWGSAVGGMLAACGGGATAP